MRLLPLLCLALLPDVAISEQRDAVVKEAIDHTFEGQLVRNRTDVAWLERVVRRPDDVSGSAVHAPAQRVGEHGRDCVVRATWRTRHAGITRRRPTD